MASNLVPASKSGLAKGEALPPILDAGGKAARFAYQEFFYGEIRNPHTRVAYHRLTVAGALPGACLAACYWVFGWE